MSAYGYPFNRCYHVPTTAEMIQELYDHYLNMVACRVAAGVGPNACPVFVPAGIQVGDTIVWDGTKFIPSSASIGTAQTITFNALSAKTTASPPFTLTATASSELAVTFESSNTAVATISGNTVTIVGAGTTNITAKQAGNGTYAAAPDVVRSLTVSVAVTFTAYWGWQDTNVMPDESEILALQGSGSFAGNANVFANFSGATGQKWLVMAEPITEPVKTRWFASNINNDPIAPDKAFDLKGTSGSFRVYMSTFETDFPTPVEFQLPI